LNIQNGDEPPEDCSTFSSDLTA